MSDRSPGPPPPRDASHLHGLDGLSAVDAAKLKAANELYAWQIDSYNFFTQKGCIGQQRTLQTHGCMYVSIGVAQKEHCLSLQLIPFSRLGEVLRWILSS